VSAASSSRDPIADSARWQSRLIPVHRKQNAQFWLMVRSKTVEHPGGERRWFGPWRFV